jgi:hypothetical protein
VKAPLYLLTLEVRENELERKLSEVHLDPSDRSLLTVIIMYKTWIQYILNWYLGLEIKNSWVDNLTFQLFHHWNTSRKMIKSKYFILTIKETSSNLKVPQTPTSSIERVLKIYNLKFIQACLKYYLEKLELGAQVLWFCCIWRLVFPLCTKLDYNLRT